MSETHFRGGMLVFPDMTQLDLTGPYEVLARLKSDPRFREIPVIMISALRELDSIVRCIEAGADHFLDKTQAMTVRDVIAGPRQNAQGEPLC